MLVLFVRRNSFMTKTIDREGGTLSEKSPILVKSINEIISSTIVNNYKFSSEMINLSKIDFTEAN